MSGRWKVLLALVGTAGIALLAGCAATRLDAQWSNPEFAGAAVSGRVFVVGVTRDDTSRRLYEDAMAAQLVGRGLQVTRSYEVLTVAPPSDGGDALLAAARGAGAAAMITSAIVGHERVHQVVTEPLPAWAWGYRGWYGHYWSLAYARTEVRTYDRYLVGTSLTDVGSGRIVWTARTSTEAPVSVEAEIKAFAALVVEALAKAGLLR